MTREEIERARELLEIHRRTSHMSCTVERGELVGLVMNHVEELLSLAEEARWRSVTEEPPQTNTWVCAVNDTVVVSGFVCCAGPGAWISYHGGHSIPAPTHWRPLPRGPVKP